MTDLTPQRIVPFYGDELAAVQQPDGDIFVLFGRLCDNLGLVQQAQVRRIRRHAVMSEGLVNLTVQTPGGPQIVQSLRLDLLPLWLAGVQAERVKEAVREKLVRYQREAAFVLWEAFKGQILVAEADSPSAEGSHAVQQLQQIAAMGRAIAIMAEQQIELQRQQEQLTERLNRAGHVVKLMQGTISDVQVRLGVLEDKLHPATYITDEQATEISNMVKALAEILTSTEKAKNHYQGIFAELYRRFGVSSYKMIRIEQYEAVLRFIADWRAATLAHEERPKA